jgi:hypothetical protein
MILVATNRSWLRAERHTGVLPPTCHSHACPQLAEVIKGCLARSPYELLVRWMGQPAGDATWVELSDVQDEFSS